MMTNQTSKEEFDYLPATTLLVKNGTINTDLQKRLDEFRCFRNRMIHSIPMGREEISKTEIDDAFENGIELDKDIRYLGNEIYADLIPDYDDD